MDNPFVWYQDIEHVDNNARVFSYPAIVSDVREVPSDPHNPDSEPVELMNLWIFRDGDIQYLRDVRPYSDDLGRQPGSQSYREWGSSPPEINLDEPASPPEPTPTRPAESGMPTGEPTPSPRGSPPVGVMP